MMTDLAYCPIYTKYSYTEDNSMDKKTEALLAYLEFNLIAMVNTLQPHLKDDVDMTEVYAEASNVLEEMRTSLTNPTGMASKSSS